MIQSYLVFGPVQLKEQILYPYPEKQKVGINQGEEALALARQLEKGLGVLKLPESLTANFQAVVANLRRTASECSPSNQPETQVVAYSSLLVCIPQTAVKREGDSVVAVEVVQLGNLAFTPERLRNSLAVLCLMGIPEEIMRARRDVACRSAGNKRRYREEPRKVRYYILIGVAEPEEENGQLVLYLDKAMFAASCTEAAITLRKHPEAFHISSLHPPKEWPYV